MKIIKMMRKKLVNRNKFEFKEDEVLPAPPQSSRIAAQSRLTKKAGNKPPYNPTVPAGRMDHNLNMNLNASYIPPPPLKMSSPPTILPKKYLAPSRVYDPVLANVVAKLKSSQLHSSGVTSSRAETPPCVCKRPLKLILCQDCGITFPARLKVICPIHPDHDYVLDVEQCKDCNQNNKKLLVSYELPAGMEAGLENMLVQRQ